MGLDEISSCRIIQLKDESSKHIKNVFLELIHEKNNERIEFCFYDESHDGFLEKTSLLMKARHWSQRINFHKTYWWIKPEEYAFK